MKSRQKASVLCVAALVSVGAARTASATTPTCMSLPNPIVISGSTAVKAYIADIGYAMSQAATPATLVYSGPGSCSGVAELLLSDGVSACGTTAGDCATGNGTYYTAPVSPATAPTANTCTFDTAGDHVDVAVSDVFMNTCVTASGGAISATGFTDLSNVIEAMAFTVPSAATGQLAITADEAYFVFGFANADNIMTTETPWINDTDLFIRTPTSGTEIVLSGEIGVPPAKWLGVQESSSGAVASGLGGLTGTTANLGLGILGIDYISGNPTGMFKALAFQAFGQNLAYYPDSTSTMKDKQNVRDGHYTPWGYAHFITRNGTGSAATANGQAVLNMLNGTTAVAGFTAEAAAIASYYVPQCAMTVQRTDDTFSTLAPYSDPHPCECGYLALATGAAPASCTACTTTSATCPACTLGYCEPR